MTMTRLLRFIVITSLLLWAAPALAAPVAYSFTGNTASGVGAATISVTVPSGGIPAGSGIYVYVYERSGNVLSNGSVADTAGTPNTYTELSGGIHDVANGNTQIFQTFNSYALTSGETITYTLAETTSYRFAVMSVFYVTGLLTSNPYDSATLNSSLIATAQPSSIQSGTPSVSGEMFLTMAGWVYDTFSPAGFTLDTANGWSAPPPTSIETGNSPYNNQYLGVAGGQQVNSGVGKLTTNPTFSNTAQLYGATVIIGLKPATGVVSSPFFFKPFP